MKIIRYIHIKPKPTTEHTRRQLLNILAAKLQEEFPDLRSATMWASPKGIGVSFHRNHYIIEIINHLNHHPEQLQATLVQATSPQDKVIDV